MQLWDLFWHSPFGGRDHQAADDCTESGPGVATLAAGAPPSAAAAAKPATQHWWARGDGASSDIPPLARPELSTEALALERVLADRVQDAAQQLPTLPKTTERVLRMLGRSQYSAADVANVLAQDQVLSAAVLRLANSALYGGRVHVTSLQFAVARLSTTALQTIALHYSLQAAVRSNLTRDRLLTDLVWNGSLASAAIMRALAGCLGTDPEEAYLIGLLHDIGNVPVVREVQDQQALLRYQLDVESFEWLCRQHHQTLGHRVAEAWELPDKVQALVADHHSPVAPDDPLGRERHMIALTDMIKSMLGYAARRDYALLTSTPAAALGLKESSAFAAFLDALPSQLRGIPAVC